MKNHLLYLWSKAFKKIRGGAVKNSFIHKDSKIEAGSLVVNSTMSRHSFCGYDCEIINCQIGSFCSIANQVVIGGGEHPMHWVGMSPVFYEGRDSVKTKFSTYKRANLPKTTIGHDVWIGYRALIKSGVEISHGAVVGMGSVVTKDIEPYAIVAGNPAKIIRKRFDQDTITLLLESKWWTWSDEKLQEYAKFFKNPERFIQALSKK